MELGLEVRKKGKIKPKFVSDTFNTSSFQDFFFHSHHILLVPFGCQGSNVILRASSEELYLGAKEKWVCGKKSLNFDAERAIKIMTILWHLTLKMLRHHYQPQRFFRTVKSQAHEHGRGFTFQNHEKYFFMSVFMTLCFGKHLELRVPAIGTTSKFTDFLMACFRSVCNAGNRTK